MPFNGCGIVLFMADITPRAYRRSVFTSRSMEDSGNMSCVEKGGKEWTSTLCVFSRWPSRKIRMSTAAVITCWPHQSMWSPKRHTLPGAEQIRELMEDVWFY